MNIIMNAKRLVVILSEDDDDLPECDILHTKFLKKIIPSKNKRFYLGIRNTKPQIISILL